MAKNEKHDEVNTQEQAARTEGPQIRWDHSKMETTYANVCNVNSTREELSLLFGINQTVNMGQSEISIELTNRIILNPYAAKRLALILNGVIQQYEAAFGALPVDIKPA